MRTITNCVCLSNTYNAIAMLLFEMLQSTHLKPGVQKSYACTTTFLSEHALCICHVVKHFFFSFSFLARTDVGSIQKMELWEIKHTRGSANTIHREVTLVNNGRQVFYRGGFIHSNCSTSFSTLLLLLFRENTPKHTHRETSFIRTRFQNVESETFFLGTWIKGPKRRQSRLDGVVHFFCKTLCESLQR